MTNKNYINSPYLYNKRGTAICTTSKQAKSVDAPQLSNLNDYLNFSMNPQSESDIESRILNNPDDICISYICRFSTLSEGFIERMIVLTSGIVDGTTPEEDIQKLMAKVIPYIVKQKRISVKCGVNIDKFSNKQVSLIEKSRKTSRGCNTTVEVHNIKGLCTYNIEDIRDKIDWTYIGQFQELSEDFIRKYINLLNPSDLLHKNISRELKKELRSKVSRDWHERVKDTEDETEEFIL